MRSQNAVPPEVVRSQLKRILQSGVFVDSPRLCRFLSYLVEQGLSGAAGDLKEYSVGLEVFDRPPSFDPKTDSIVRSTARKLRTKLGEYYQNGGSADPVVIDVPKGGYAPEFRVAAQNRKRWLWPVVAAAALVMTALTALGWRSGAPDVNPSVAVFEIGNASGNAGDTWLSTALAEMITEDLSANEGLRTISTEQVAQVQRDFAATGMRALVRRAVPELQNRLDARYAVLADFHAASGMASLQVDTRLERSRDGKIVMQSSDKGTETELYALTAIIARKIRLALGVPQGEAAALRGPDRDSMRLYSEAVVKLRDSDPLSARGLLEKSANADSSNFLARSLLAETYFTLGMEAQAKIEGQAALALAPPLPPVERLALEARCYGAMRDYAAAARSYQQLWRMSPEAAEYGFGAEEMQEKSGANAEALQTLLALRRNRLSPADDARIDFAEASVRAKLGEYQKGLVLVRRCEWKASRLKARYLFARARLREGGLLMNLVMPGPLAALDEGLSICRAVGDRACEVNALRQEGNYFAPGQPQRAMELYDQGAAVARQTGNRRGLVELLRGMTYVAARQMADEEAERRDREMIMVIQDERLSDKAWSLVDLAELLVAEGRLEEADRFLTQISPSPQQNFSWNLCKSSIERNRGDYEAAARRVGVQVECARKTDDRYALSLAIEEAFLVHQGQGDLRRASADLQELDQIRPFAPRTPYLRAELALARGRWEEAQSQAAEATRRYQEVDRALEAAIAIVNAEALTGLGRPAEALRALDRIAPALDQSRHAPLQLRARACRLRAEALMGACPGAVLAQDLLHAARKLGIPWVVREAERTEKTIRAKCGTAVYAARR